MGRFLLTTHLTSSSSSFTTTTTATNDTTDLPCTDFCDPSCGDFDACYAFPAIPDDTLPPPPLLPPPPPTTTVATPSSSNFIHDLFNLSPIAIVIIIVLASAILLISYYAVVIKYCSLLTRLITRRDLARMQPNQSSDPNNPRTTAANNQFVDHPIWLISTVGLPQSMINGITVIRYKEDGLIDCTDCSVCLSEFQQGETLRHLSKCRHAFHIECIDTWLRSHTTCPMCRASITVPNPNSPTSGHSGRGEFSQVVDSDSNDLELGNTQHGISTSNHNNNNNNNNNNSNDSVTLLVGEDRGTQTGEYVAATNILEILLRRSNSVDYQNSGMQPNVSSSNSSASSSSRPLHQRVSLKRSYSWSEKVFCQNDRNSVMSP